MAFIIFEKLKIKQAIEIMINLEKWFNGNKTRKVCKTSLFKVRRNHILEDVLKHTDYET